MLVELIVAKCDVNRTSKRIDEVGPDMSSFAVVEWYFRWYGSHADVAVCSLLCISRYMYRSSRDIVMARGYMSRVYRPDTM
jgi:hypothetical protein